MAKWNRQVFGGNKMICGVTVLYNPSGEVIENITSYLKELNKLYLIDNSEIEDNILKNKFLELSPKIEYIKLNGNEGIAKALNIAKNRAIKENYNWLLTMDQDSKFENNDFPKMLDLMKKYFNENIAIFSPFHKTIGSIYENKDILKKDTVMTSGNLLNLKIAQKVGDFEEKFFIDEVDHNYCCRIKKLGYEIIVLNKIILEHKLGNIKKYKFFSVTNHNYVRRYYITRNRLYMIKEYSFLKKRYIKDIIKDAIKIILAEKDKVRKLKMIYYGMRDYKNNIVGKINKDYL